MTYYQKRRMEILWPRKRRPKQKRVLGLMLEIQKAAKELTRQRRDSSRLAEYWVGV